MSPNSPPDILITGTSGFIGRNLIAHLAKQGIAFRCLVREEEALPGMALPVWGDVLHEPSLAEPMRGVKTAFYLIHSLGARGDMRIKDRLAAANFASVCRQSQVQRIIYLSNLGDEMVDRSGFLGSRREIGAILANSGCQVLELRAAPVLGAGGLAFEIARAVCESLPFIMCPSWIHTPIQPVALPDLITLLRESINLPVRSQYDIRIITGPEKTTFRHIFNAYCEERDITRAMSPVPALCPLLSGFVLRQLLPVSSQACRAFIEALRAPITQPDNAQPDPDSILPTNWKTALLQAMRSDMPKHLTQHYIKRSVIAAAAQEVYNWHAHPEALNRLTPPWEQIDIIRKIGSIEQGGQVEMAIKSKLRPISWLAEHTEHEHGRYFSDVQIRGPFAYWKHYHRMIPAEAGSSILEDHISYLVPYGKLGDLLFGPFIRARLRRSFNYRHQVIEEAFAHNAAKIGKDTDRSMKPRKRGQQPTSSA